MKSLRYLIAVAALALTLPAQAAVGDPEVVLYRASGVADGGSGSNAATIFSCTPFSGVTENIRIVLRDRTGAIVINVLAGAAHLNTEIFSTASSSTLYSAVVLGTGPITGGTVAIAATSTSVTCTAMLLQPNNTAPVGVQLHMTRFSPLAGTAE